MLHGWACPDTDTRSFPVTCLWRAECGIRGVSDLEPSETLLPYLFAVGFCIPGMWFREKSY